MKLFKSNIIGIDEVGRGCVAGPIVCASFSLDKKVLVKICKLAKNNFQTETKLHKKKLYERLTKLTYYDIKSVESLPAQTGQKPIAEKIKNKNNSPIHQFTNLQNTSSLSADQNFNLELLSLVFDSKKVTEKNRKIVAEYLLQLGKWGIGVVSNSVIDIKGIQYANKLAMLKSLSPHFTKYFELSTKYYVLTDHLDPRGIDYKINKEYNFFTSDKMDCKSFVTASSSIIAKVYRDSLMGEYHSKFPEYGFNNHVGYGTSLHMLKIKELGLTNIHRKSFLESFCE